IDGDGNEFGGPISDHDPSHYIGAIFNIEKAADNDEVCEDDEVNYTVTLRLSGQIFGLNARMIMATDTAYFLESGTQDGFDLMPFITATSDGNNNLRIDNNEEWVFEYSRTLTENTSNTAFEMFDIYRNDQFIEMIMGDSSQTVIVNPKPVVVVADTDPDGSISCSGADDGSLTAAVTSGGTPPFSYAWSAGTQNPASPETVTVTV
ncbi:MAG: SprB repeat-containing protein, partial [Bacteroidota bacterium]